MFRDALYLTMNGYKSSNLNEKRKILVKISGQNLKNHEKITFDLK